MQTIRSNLLWSLIIASAITAAGIWLFEIHLQIPIWDSYLWWLYPLFFVGLAGSMLRQLNEQSLVERHLMELDESVTESVGASRASRRAVRPRA